MTELNLNLGANSYKIIIQKGVISKADKYFNLNRKVLILTDGGVPEEYSKTIASLCKEYKIVTLPQGEGSKSFEGLQKVLSAMLEFGMDRKDCLVAVGGGIMGDLGGFASSTYMRGIDFYNVPTTLLAQVDSSIGGKTAINFNGVKNIIGAFYQPKCVLIDTLVLTTLPERQLSNGLAEAVKMSLTSDEKLFEKFEKLSFEDIKKNLEEIIVSSLKIKKHVVEQDERESGLRKILNFGHTFGHGVEAQMELKGMYHGECVAVGMIATCSEKVRQRLVPVLQKLNLPTTCDCDVDKALKFVLHDKKRADNCIDAVLVNNVGSFEIKRLTFEEFNDIIKKIF